MPVLQGRTYTVATLKGATGFAYAGPPPSGSEATMFDQMLADMLAEFEAADVDGVAPGAAGGMLVSNGSAWIRSAAHTFLNSGFSAIGDTSNAFMTVGLTINQGTADNELFAGKSSEINHGITDYAETDTFGTLAKADGDLGGVLIRGYSEGEQGIVAQAFVTTDSALRSTAATAPVHLTAHKKSGTGIGNMGADKNLVVIRNNGTTTQIFDSDGDSHQDVGTAWTNFDTHDDIALLNLLAAKVTRRDDPLRATFGRILRENRKELERVKLVTFNRDGHHFVNMSRLTMLHTGALRQLGAQMGAAWEALRALGADLPELSQFSGARTLTA